MSSGIHGGLLPGRAQYPLNRVHGFVVIAATQYWQVPEGVFRVKATVVGAGGGGGSDNAGINATNEGGGGGGAAIKLCTVRPGEHILCTIGAAGQGVGNNPGTTGGTSSFGSYCSATGGGGGETITASTTYGGAPGNGVGGDLNIPGDYGDPSNPNTTAPEYPQQHGGGSLLGWGPRATKGLAATNGEPGRGYGGGGGGAIETSNADRVGGDGTAGVIILEY